MRTLPRIALTLTGLAASIAMAGAVALRPSSVEQRVEALAAELTNDE